MNNRLGRAGGPAALRDSRLCQPVLPIPHLPVLTRSAALLMLLLQDGTVDLELTTSVIALDPGLALWTLRAADPEHDRQGEIWELPLAVVAAGCDRLLSVAKNAPKVESNFDCVTSRLLRQLYLRCVQQACIAEMLITNLGGANPKQSYVAGLLCGLPGILNFAEAIGPGFSAVLRDAVSTSSPAGKLALVASALTAAAKRDPVAASVILANQVLELPEAESAEATQALAFGPLWDSWEGRTSRERCELLARALKTGKWVVANAQRLSPWEFMARLHRHKSWE